MSFLIAGFFNDTNKLYYKASATICWPVLKTQSLLKFQLPVILAIIYLNLDT